MAWAWIITVVDKDNPEILIDADVRHDLREVQQLYEYWKKLYEPQYKVTIGH